MKFFFLMDSLRAAFEYMGFLSFKVAFLFLLKTFKENVEKINQLFVPRIKKLILETHTFWKLRGKVVVWVKEWTWLHFGDFFLILGVVLVKIIL